LIFLSIIFASPRPFTFRVRAVRLIHAVPCVLFFLFVYCCGPPRDLHSFPTRRSSDLRRLGVAFNSFYGENGRYPQSWGALADWRSEEHTSELQSHLNLVCRLLLEKKNTTAAHFPAVSLRVASIHVKRALSTDDQATC